jgi:5-methylcytosine-specific restriction endonuclease McrA
VYFALDGGRQRSPFVGPSFERPHDAIRLANLLNRDVPASRPGPSVIPAAASQTFRKDDQRASGNLSSPTRAPEPDPAPSTAGDRVCVSCGGPLPRGSRADRRTCSLACRQEAHRQRIGPDLRQATGAADGANQKARALGLPGRITPADVLDVWAREPECVRCGKGRGIDHISPMASGGPNELANLQDLCPPCNAEKAAAERRVPQHAATKRRRMDTGSGVTHSEPQRPSTGGPALTSGAAIPPSPSPRRPGRGRAHTRRGSGRQLGLGLRGH